MKFRICLVLLAAFVAAFAGCKGEQRPEGLPDLHPFSVKILQEGAPLEGASVTLVSGDPALMKWPCGGVTNAEGIAALNTYGYAGAPAGSFKVVVSKTVEEGGVTADESVQAMTDGTAAGSDSKMFDLVDPTYKFDSKTPLTVEVSAGNNAEIPEFDVGAAVHQELKM